MAKAGSRYLKIRKQPSGAGLRRRRKLRNDLRQQRLGKTIEEEMSHDQIERWRERRPFRQCRLNECRPRRPPARFLPSGAGAIEHRTACIHAYNPGLRQLAGAYLEESARPFTDNQNVAAIANFLQPRKPAALQFLPGQDEFHPTIMWRETIKAHRVGIFRAPPDATRLRLPHR